MARPRKVVFDLKKKLHAMRQAGLTTEVRDRRGEVEADGEMPVLNERIRQILRLVKDKPMKATEMLYLVMYDIEDDKVRTLIAKYLIQKGCIRIQKSVYLSRTKPRVFEEINKTLKEVQEAYDNHDSIILVPVHAQAAGSMRIIGKDVQIEALVDDPNTLFF